MNPDDFLQNQSIFRHYTWAMNHLGLNVASTDTPEEILNGVTEVVDHVQKETKVHFKSPDLSRTDQGIDTGWKPLDLSEGIRPHYDFSWETGDTNPLQDLEAMKEILERFRVPENQMEEPDDLEDDETPEPEWEASPFRIGERLAFTCPVCAIPIIDSPVHPLNELKDKHEHWHRTVACDWYD